jgi:hypothetical protein
LASGWAERRRLGHVTEPGGDYDQHLMRLAALLIRDQAAAEQVVRDVRASSPPHVRDADAERRAVAIRCRAIIRESKGLPPD